MTKTSSQLKQQAMRKMLEFQKKGLQQYRRYLDAQLKYASASERRREYKKYLEHQILLNERKIRSVTGRLGAYETKDLSSGVFHQSV